MDYEMIADFLQERGEDCLVAINTPPHKNQELIFTFGQQHIIRGIGEQHKIETWRPSIVTR
jgi:hypothetical protein